MKTNTNPNFPAIKQTNIKDEQFSASYGLGANAIKMQAFGHQESSSTATKFGTAVTMSSSQTFVKEETSVQQFSSTDFSMLSSNDKRRPSFIRDEIKMIQDLNLIKVRVKGPETTNLSDEDNILETTVDLALRRLPLPDVDVAHEITLKTVDHMEVTGKVTTSSKSRRFSTHTEEASAYIQVAELTQGESLELDMEQLGMIKVLFTFS